MSEDKIKLLDDKITTLPDSEKPAVILPDNNGGNGKDREKVVSWDAFEEVRADRSRKNKLLEAERAKNKKYEEAEEARKKASMEEVDRLRLEKEEAEKKIVAAESRAANLSRVNLVIGKDVQSQYADYVAGEMAKMEKDSDFDADTWIKDLKIKNPAFFKDYRTDSVARTAEGGPSSVQALSKTAAQIQELEEELKKETNPQQRTYLRRSIRALEGQSKGS